MAKRKKKITNPPETYSPNFSDEILALQEELGPLSVEECSQNFILEETKTVVDRMIDRITPEVWQVIENNNKNGLPDLHDLSNEIQAKVEKFSKIAQSELARISKKARLIELYENEIKKSIPPMLEAWQRVKSWQMEGYEKQEKSLKHYLAGQNWIVPADGKEFLEWFLGVKHGAVFVTDFFEKNLTASPADFREFHEWKEPQVWEGSTLDEKKAQPTFDQIFVSISAMEKAVISARNCGLIGEEDQWIFVGPKTFAASAFWKAVVASGLGKADMAKATVSKVISERFRIRLGKNAIGMDSGEFDQGLYTKLLAAMKST